MNWGYRLNYFIIITKKRLVSCDMIMSIKKSRKTLFPD